MKNIIRSKIWQLTLRMFAGCLLLAAFPMMSCDNRNIHQVVKAMAASEVDTVGWPGKMMETNPFSSVYIDCFADVTFHQTPVGSEHYLEMKAPGKVMENIDVKVEDGDLLVSVNRRYRMPEKAVVVINIYAPFVNSFVLAGGKCLRLGKVSLTCPLELMVDGNVGTMLADSITAHEVSLLLEGTGSYDLKGIHTGDVRSKIVGNGSVCLAGQCHTAKMTIKGDGKIDISALSYDSIQSEDILGNGKVLK